MAPLIGTVICLFEAAPATSSTEPKADAFSRE
jgi:hypothetical protein